MRNHSRKHRLNNSGLTLIELIVVIAIIAIFSGVVLAYITSSSNFYRNTSNNSKVQMETQETFDKIEDMIINANRNLYYFTDDKKVISNDIKGKGAENSSGGKIFMVSAGDDSELDSQMDDDEDVAVMSASNIGTGNTAIDLGNTENTTTVLKNESDRQCIVWEKSTSEVKYVHYVKVGNSWRRISQEDEILATGILDFRADISKALSDKIVRFQLTTQKGTKTIETLHSVSLRNELGISEQIDIDPAIDPDIDPVEPIPTETPTPEPTKEPMPIELTADIDSILIGAGNTVDLNKIIKWTLRYDDGTQKQSDLNLVWKSNKDFGNITSMGKITISSDAGTESSGELEITVIDIDSGISGTVKVRIARIDINNPEKGGTYAVGDDRSLSYVYMEGGTKVDNVKATINTIQKPEGTEDYSGEGQFEQIDIGTWSVKAEIDLSSRNGYGIVKDQNTFYVGDRLTGDGEIEINQTKSINTIVAGFDYECAPSVNWGFNFCPKNKEDAWENYRINWSLLGKHPGVNITQTSNSKATIHVDSAIFYNGQEKKDYIPSGFTVQAEYIQYARGDVNQTTPIYTKVSTKQVNVAYGIHLIPTQSVAYVDEAYAMNMQLRVSKWDGSKTVIPVSSTGNGVKVTWEKSDGSVSGIVKTNAKGQWTFKAPSGVVDKSIIVGAHLQEMGGIFCSKTTFYLYDTFTVNVEAPPLTAQIIPDGDETIEYGENQELYLNILDKRDGKAVSRNVTWSFVNNNESAGSLSKYSTGSGEKETTVFSAKKSGTYTIKAVYEIVAGKSVTLQKTITVRKPEVELIIHGDTSGYKGDSKQYWLEAKIDGTVVTDLDVVWHQNSKWETNLGTTKSNEDSKVTVQYGLYQGSPYKLLALVNIAGEEYTKIQEITLNEHQYEAVVKVRDASTKQELPIVNKGQNVELYIKTTIDGNLTEEYDVKWEYYGNKENDKVSIEGKLMKCTPANIGDLNYQAVVTVGVKTFYLKTRIPVIE